MTKVVIDWPLQNKILGCATAKNIRLRIEIVERNIFNTMTGQFTTAKTSGCANVWSNSSRACKACGWDGGHLGLTVWNLLSCTRIENAHKIFKKTFVLYYVAVICTTTGGTDQIRDDVSLLFNPPELPIRDAGTGVNDGELVPAFWKGEQRATRALTYQYHK